MLTTIMLMIMLLTMIVSLERAPEVLPSTSIHPLMFFGLLNPTIFRVFIVQARFFLLRRLSMFIHSHSNIRIFWHFLSFLSFARSPAPASCWSNASLLGSTGRCNGSFTTKRQPTLHRGIVQALKVYQAIRAENGIHTSSYPRHCIYLNNTVARYSKAQWKYTCIRRRRRGAVVL